MESITNRPALSLLLVEDDKSAIAVLNAMIQRKFPDIAIFTAADGRQGVELGKEHSPDIVITDINMPGMDGLQMAGEIKSIKPDTRIIVFTGYSDKIHLDNFDAIGISAYILKPIEFQQLFTAIEKCIAEIVRNDDDQAR